MELFLREMYKTATTVMKINVEYMRKSLIWGVSVFFLVVFGTGVQAGTIDEEIWVLVDTKTRSISVKQGKHTRAVYNNIAIGRNGATRDKIRGDYKTPLGIYRVGWVNPNSRFHRFYGVTYPSRVDAGRALKKGMIDRSTYQELLRADLLNQVPNQNTRLGGQIGIHGIGGADPFIHKTMNWTRGCIAVTDEQINSLGAWMKKGAVVVIR